MFRQISDDAKNEKTPSSVVLGDNAPMEWLNYHHLFYFNVIVQEGGVAAAARKLRLTHSTLSTQLRALEASLGVPLFERRGKRLVLTPFGAEAASYAVDIFRLGRELNEIAHGRASPRRERIRVGLVPNLPKTLTHRLLAPALDRLEGGSAIIRQDTPQALLDLLVTGRLHLLLMDHMPTTPPGTRIHAHLLGETDILLYARARLARQARRGFPGTLADVPFVLPPGDVPLRKRLDAWFAQHDLRARVVAEIEDSGLLRVFGKMGRGVFPVRAALTAEVEDLHDVAFVGACEGVRERYYAVTTERRIRHPALNALVENARRDLKPILP
jgi:LysR family transcriptional activator of nhaA